MYKTRSNSRSKTHTKIKKRNEKRTAIKKNEKKNVPKIEPLFVYLPKPNNKIVDNVNYVDICNKLNTYITDEEGRKMVGIIKTKLLNIQEIGNNYHHKTTFITEFLTYVKITFDLCLIISDTTLRKYIECVHNMNKIFADEIYGNPKYMEIIFEIQTNEITKIVEFIMTICKSSTQEIDKRPLFGIYRLDYVKYIKNVNMDNIQTNDCSFSIIVTNITNNISMNCMIIYKTDNTNNIDFTVDKLYSSNYLHHIAEKKVVTRFNMTKYIRRLYGDINKTMRKKILIKIYDILTNGIKYMVHGYEHFLIGENSTFDYTIETVEACPITLTEPPYINMNLECMHKLSINALYGILTKSGNDNYTCPQCRKLIIPKLVLLKNNINTPPKEHTDTTFNMESVIEHQYVTINNNLELYKKELEEDKEASEDSDLDSEEEWENYFNGNENLDNMIQSIFNM